MSTNETETATDELEQFRRQMAVHPVDGDPTTELITLEDDEPLHPGYAWEREMGQAT